jgi:hypothetical protein
MKHLKKIQLGFCLALSTVTLTAQVVTLAKGGQTEIKQVIGSDPVNFFANGDHYFFEVYMERAMMNYHLQSFDSKGGFLANTALEVSVGVLNNSYSIDQVIGFGNKAYAMVEHLDKPAGKNTLLARTIDNMGKVSTSEVEVMSIPFEKTMNSGFNYTSVSSDNKTMAVVGEMIYVKEQPAQYKIALFDQELKKTKEGTITIAGENTKNKSISQVVANDGTVYIIKKGMTKKGEITLNVYQWLPETPSEYKEYTLEVVEPNQFYNYSYAVNSSNELIISGLYYERKTFSAGEKKAVGVFYFTNKGKSEKVFKTFALDAQVDNLTSRKLLINGNTIFLTAEQYKEERITPPASAAGSLAALDYHYNYIHKSEFVIAMDNEGTKKFQLELNKDFTARDFDKPFFSSYNIVNGKLTIVYNDQAKKYVKDDYNYSYQIPVLVQITNDGLMQSPVVLKNELKLEQYYILNPTYSLQTSNNQISFLMGNNQFYKFVGLKID